MRENRFAADVVKLAGGATAAQLLTILVAPVLTRLYTPEAFGVAALFGSIVGILGVVACFRYELAILLPKRDDDASNVLGISLFATTVTAAVSVLLVWLCRVPFLRLLGAEGLAPYLWLIPVSVLFGGLALAFNYWNSRTKHFGRLAMTRTIQSVTINGSQLTLGLVGLAYAGSLIWGTVGGAAIAALILGVFIWRDEGRFFAASIRWRKLAESARRYRKFPLIDLWGGLINAASQQLPIPLLGMYFTESAMGYYAMASRAIYLPMTLVGSAIGQVFFQRAAELQRNGESLEIVVSKVFQRLVMLSLLPSFLIAVTGQEWFVLIFGSSWAEAGRFVQILGPWMFFWFVSAPLTVLFVVLERLDLALIVHVVLLVSRVLPLVIGGILGDVYLALYLFAGSGVLIYGGLAIWCMVLANVSIKEPLRVISREILHSLPIIGAVLLLQAGFDAPVWMVLTTSGIGLIGHFLLVVLHRDPELANYLAAFLRRSRND